ncbi:MAG TPA: SUMF1/EgtB/PvdO family nonheme iron enzyme [Chthoniobacter sp.]
MALAAAHCLLQASPSHAAEPEPLATITVATSSTVKVLPLSAGQTRLANSKWTFKKVRADLNGAQFTSIPPRFPSQYQIHVETPGVIYAFAVRKKKTLEQYLGENDPRWMPDDAAVEGSNPLACYRRTVAPGETIVLHGFELQLAAANISLGGAVATTSNRTPATAATGNVAQPPSEQIQPYLEPSLNAILAPLQDDPSMPRVAVETLGAKLGAGVVKARTSAQKQIYECAVAVCSALTAGMDARAQAKADAVASGLLPSVSNGASIEKTSPLHGRGAGGAGEAIRKKEMDERNYADNQGKAVSKFMESSAYKAWVAKAKALREDAMGLYAKLVQLEAVDPAFDPSASVAPPSTQSTAAAAAPSPKTDAAPALASLSAPTSVSPPATESFVNTLGMKFVPVPGVKALFSIWDTRVQDYAAYAGANSVDGSWTKQQKNGVPVSRESNDPVVGVSWDDANAFCRWLTETERAKGTLPNNSRYRLPTDEEWSRAVGLEEEKGATPAEKDRMNHTDFPWGAQFPPPQANLGNYGDAVWHRKFPHEGRIEGYSDGFATTAPVGSFPPNRFGLYDMGGNVWQWCEDWFDGSHKWRVLRGTSWTDYRKDDLLSAARLHRTPTIRGSGFGFRCVLESQK